MMNPKDRYDSMFVFYGAVSNVDWKFLKAQAICESNLDPDIPGPTGDLGLTQFTEPTWAGITKSWERLTAKGTPRLIDRRNPECAIRAQAQFMGSLMRQFVNDRSKAVAAYNWGPGRVAKVFGEGPYDPEKVPEVTRHYVRKVLETYLTL